MKNLILNHEACNFIDDILINRKIFKKGEKFAHETVSYISAFLEGSCLYEEIIIEDEIFYNKKTIKEIFSYLSDDDIKEIIKNY